jgi:hypothetical protein
MIVSHYLHGKKEQAYVVTVGKMATIWKTQTHEPVLGLDEGSQSSKARV